MNSLALVDDVQDHIYNKWSSNAKNIAMHVKDLTEFYATSYIVYIMYSDR